MRLFKRLRNRFKEILPQTPEALEAFAKDIIETYGLPDSLDMKYSIITMVMHVDPTKDSAPRHFFAVTARKAIATKAAFDLGQSLKTEMKALEAQKAELEKSMQGSTIEPVQNEGVQGS